MKIRFLMLLMAISMTACSVGKRDLPREFPMLGQVSSVNVKLGSMPFVKITNPQKVSQIVAFVDSHRMGWMKPWYGIPVPAVTVEFFDGMVFKGSFGAGNAFFETQREGGFFSQSASPSEVHRFLDLAGVGHDRE
jgi:hypothetical protein